MLPQVTLRRAGDGTRHPHSGYNTRVGHLRAAIGVIGGRYRLEGLLGEGGMARVFDAFDERLERPVAVKILRPETEALPGMRTRFQQEARLSARLIHPNIVGVLDYGEDGASSYLVMERLPGSTLRDEISQGPVPPDRLVSVITETLAALAAAHRFGVLHRDIKPSNILLQDDRHVKITDFGIAKSVDGVTAPDAADPDLTMTGVVLGTPGYLAPERQWGHPATVESDLYSVGAVMVEALTGCRALPDGVRDGHVCSSPLRDVAARAMAADPDDRFPSADAMIEALRVEVQPIRGSAPRGATAPMAATTQVSSGPPALRGGTAVMGTPPVGAPSARRTRSTRRRRVGVALAALLAVAAASLLALFLAERTTPRTPAVHAASQRTHGGHSRSTDAERTSISRLAASLATNGQPGDGALAAALGATAAQSPGPGRQAAADQTLALAQVLLAGGGITDRQYQDVVSVLAPTGATVPATTAPTVTVPSPTPPSLGPPGHGHHQGGNQGDSG